MRQVKTPFKYPIRQPSSIDRTSAGSGPMDAFSSRTKIMLTKA